MPTFQEILRSLKGQVPEIAPAQALEKAQQAQAIIIDVREAEELSEGRIPQALHLPRGFLELKIEGLSSLGLTPIVAAIPAEELVSTEESGGGDSEEEKTNLNERRSGFF